MSARDVLQRASAENISRAQTLILQGKAFAVVGDPVLQPIVNALSEFGVTSIASQRFKAEARAREQVERDQVEREQLVFKPTPVSEQAKRTDLLGKLIREEQRQKEIKRAEGVVFFTRKEAEAREIKQVPSPFPIEKTQAQKDIEFAERVTRTKDSGVVGVPVAQLDIKRPSLERLAEIRSPFIATVVFGIPEVRQLRREGRLIEGFLPLTPVGVPIGKVPKVFFAGKTQLIGRTGAITRVVAVTSKGEKVIAQSITTFGKQGRVFVGKTVTVGARVQRVLLPTGKVITRISKPFVAGDVFVATRKADVIRQLGAGRIFKITKAGKLKDVREFVSLGKAIDLKGRIFSVGTIAGKRGVRIKQAGILDIIGKGGIDRTGGISTQLFQKSALISTQQAVTSALAPTVSKLDILKTIPVSTAIISSIKTPSTIQTIKTPSAIQTIKTQKTQGIQTIQTTKQLPTQITKQRQIIFPSLKIQTAQKGAQVLLIKQVIKSVVEPKQKVIQVLKPRVLTRTRTTQALRLAQIGALRSVSALRLAGGISPPFFPKTIIGGLLPPFKRGKKKERRRDFFGVAVRRRGKFRIIGTGLSIQKAIEIGKGRVGRTLSATFKIIGAGKLPTEIKGFRRKGRLFIERKERRIKPITTGSFEVPELQRAKRRKKKKR